MSYLPYCILRDGDLARGCAPRGVDGETVALIAAAGLAAPYSAVPKEYALPNVPRATAYARVVAAFHQVDTVLPLRYGDLMPNRAQLAELLRERSAEFHALLDQLEGCEEMGLHLLLRAAEGISEPDAIPVGRTARPGWPETPGARYLARRRAYYVQRERHGQHAASAAERIRRAFDGLFVKCRARDPSVSDGRLLSLYFLIRRQDASAFRQAFRRLQGTGTDRVLLLGPWPPYTFVTQGQNGDGP